MNNLHSIRNQQQGPRTGSQERGRAFVSGLKSHHNVVSDQQKEQKGCGPLLCIFSSQRLPLVGPGLAGMTTGLVSSLAQENKAQGEAGAPTPLLWSQQNEHRSKPATSGNGEAPPPSFTGAPTCAPAGVRREHRCSGGPIFLLPSSNPTGSDGRIPQAFFAKRSCRNQPRTCTIRQLSGMNAAFIHKFPCSQVPGRILRLKCVFLHSSLQETTLAPGKRKQAQEGGHHSSRLRLRLQPRAPSTAHPLPVCPSGQSQHHHIYIHTRLGK